MKKYSVWGFLIALSLLFTGCGSVMTPSPNQTIGKAGNDESQVVFFRSSSVGAAVDASLYEVTGGDIKFIGVISYGTKVAFRTLPGKHTFMVVGENADFMEADLAAGKTYYGVVTPRFGAWTIRFSLWPVKRAEGSDYHFDAPAVKRWIQKTKLMENSEKSHRWYEKKKANIRKMHDKYLPLWEKKSPEDLARRFLILSRKTLFPSRCGFRRTGNSRFFNAPLSLLLLG